MSWEAVAAILPRAVVFACFAYHFIRTLKVWAHHRDARGYRDFLIALALALGTGAILVGGLATYAFPALAYYARMLAVVTAGSLLPIGIFAALSWHRDRRRGD